MRRKGRKWGEEGGGQQEQGPVGEVEGSNLYDDGDDYVGRRKAEGAWMWRRRWSWRLVGVVE